MVFQLAYKVIRYLLHYASLRETLHVTLLNIVRYSMNDLVHHGNKSSLVVDNS